MNDSFNQKTFAALVSFLLLSASAVAVIDEDQRPEFMDLVTHTTGAYVGWIVGTR